MKNLVARFVRDEEGQDLIEYSLLAALIAVACIAAMNTLAGNINGRRYADAVRVSRSQHVSGAGERYEVGVEFLWLHPPLERSLRQYAAVLTVSLTG